MKYPSIRSQPMLSRKPLLNRLRKRLFGRRLVRLLLAVVMLYASAAESPAVEPNVEGADKWQQRVTLELYDTDVEAAMRIIAETAETNIVLAPGVSGRIRRLRVVDVPLKQLFETILRLHGLYAEIEGNVTIIYPVKDFLVHSKKRRGR